VYETGSNSAIKTTTIYAPNTRYSDNIYYPGKSYEFYIYARWVKLMFEFLFESVLKLVLNIACDVTRIEHF
jgi:hypothetical protein